MQEPLLDEFACKLNVALRCPLRVRHPRGRPDNQGQRQHRVCAKAHTCDPRQRVQAGAGQASAAPHRHRDKLGMNRVDRGTFDGHHSPSVEGRPRCAQIATTRPHPSPTVMLRPGEGATPGRCTLSGELSSRPHLYIRCGGAGRLPHGWPPLFARALSGVEKSPARGEALLFGGTRWRNGPAKTSPATRSNVIRRVYFYGRCHQEKAPRLERGSLSEVVQVAKASCARAPPAVPPP